VDDRIKGTPWEIITAFSEELAEINRIRTDSGMTDFVARLFVRTLFSIFDGYAFYLKQQALAGAAGAGITFSKAEMEVIRELREVQTATGVDIRPKIIPTRENLLFALKAFGRVRGSAPPLVANSLPAAFGVAAEVRNRITHPKKTADFLVSQTERDAVAQLMIWWKEVMDWARRAELTYIEHIKQQIHDSTQEMIRRIEEEGGKLPKA